jgi:hypothetical protein
MTLNNSTSITSSPGQAKGERFKHGSILGGKTVAAGQFSVEIKTRLVDLMAEIARAERFNERPALDSCEAKNAFEDRQEPQRRSHYTSKERS